MSMRLVAVALACAGAVFAEDREPARGVVLFGWDGAQRAHVTECLARGELPTLAGLIRDGSWSEIEVEGTTDTKAGWSQILTGHLPEVTGVFSNREYQPIPEGLTVFERLEARVRADDFVSLAVIGKKDHVDREGPRLRRLDDVRRRQRAARARGRKAPPPEGDVIVDRDGVEWLATPGKPWHLVAPRLDLFVNGLKTDEAVGTRAIEELDRVGDRPFLLFVHFAETDAAGHRYGENSPQYTAALRSNDAWTGRVLAKLEELGRRDTTRVLVTADHGFDEGLEGHRDAPHVFLVTDDARVTLHGRRQDIAPTIYAEFGIETTFDPPLDGRSLVAAGAP